MGSLADFYRRRLKRYPAVRVPKEAVWYALWYARWKLAPPMLRTVRSLSVLPTVLRTVLPWPVRRSVLSFSVRHGWRRPRSEGVRVVKERPPRLALVSYSRAAAHTRTLATELFPAATVQAPWPEVFPARLAGTVAHLERSYTFPAVRLRQWRDAEVAGRSNMVVASGQLLHHDVYRFSHDFTSEELHSRLRLLPRSRSALRLQLPEVRAHFERAAAFTDSCSSNYAHWLTEVLPRLHAYACARRDDEASILLDAGLHANLRASADLVLGPGARIAEIELGASAHVDCLDVVDPAGYIPFDRRRNHRTGHAQGIFSPPVFRSLREHLAARIGPPAQLLPKKVLIRRNSGLRSLLNEQELEDRLGPLGFVSIYPERLSFAEQFQLFSGLDVVVGATGAAMASLVFCRPEARIVVCLSLHPAHIYGYWQNMACAGGGSVAYVVGPVRGGHGATVHADFSVDVGDVLAAVQGPAP